MSATLYRKATLLSLFFHNFKKSCYFSAPTSVSTLKTLFWDTAGQERYRSIAHNFFRGANAVIVVYDVTDADSLIDVDKWIRDMEDATGGQEDLQ